MKNVKKTSTPTKTSMKPNAKKAMPKKAVTTNFTRRTVVPNIEQTSPTTYRARLSVNGKYFSDMFTSLNTAKTWVNKIRKNGGLTA